MEYRHSPECQAVTESWKEQVRAFETKHPRYCRHCGGAGYFKEYFKPAPGPGYMEETYPCPKCEEEGFCALCSKALDEEGERTCGCAYEDFLPAEPECSCWEDPDWEGWE